MQRFAKIGNGFTRQRFLENALSQIFDRVLDTRLQSFKEQIQQKKSCIQYSYWKFRNSVQQNIKQIQTKFPKSTKRCISLEELHTVNESKITLTDLLKTRKNFCITKLEKRIKLDLDSNLTCVPRGVVRALSSIIVMRTIISYQSHIL